MPKIKENKDVKKAPKNNKFSSSLMTNNALSCCDFRWNEKKTLSRSSSNLNIIYLCILKCHFFVIKYLSLLLLGCLVYFFGI